MMERQAVTDVAERRMFSKTVINAAKFLKMPCSARLLYYDLGMAADDDGVAEGFTVIRMTGASEEDLEVLIGKGFIRKLNDDDVVAIKDWQRNNYIQKDRYQPSLYQDMLMPDEGADVRFGKSNGKKNKDNLTNNDNDKSQSEGRNESENDMYTGKYTPCIHDVYGSDTEPDTVVDTSPDTQVRLGKVRLGKDSIGEVKSKEIDKSISCCPNGVGQRVSYTEDVKAAVEKWNALGLQQVERISAKSNRYKNLVQRIKDNGLDEVLHVFNMVGESDFLMGKTTNFQATFDWVVTKGKFEKIQNGNYVNRSQNSNASLGNVFLDLVESGELEN